MAPQVLVLRSPRWIWQAGLAVSAVSLAVAIALDHPAPLVGMFGGLLVASFPLIARLDAVKLDGPQLSVRKAVRWVGPIDLRRLVALLYVPQAYRRPAQWLLIQREAGPRFRARHWIGVDTELRERLADQRDLRIVTVAAGSKLAVFPGLAAHLAEHATGPATLVADQAARALLHHARAEFARSDVFR